MITDPLLDVPVRAGFQFFHADDVDVRGDPEACTVTRIADGVVYYDKGSGGTSSEYEVSFPGVVGLIIADSPPASAPAAPRPNPTLDVWRLDNPRMAVVLDSLDAAVMAEIEDTYGAYGGQPLPSNMVDQLADDTYVREQITQLFNNDTINFQEVRRLRTILGDDELPPVWSAGLTAAVWNPNLHPRDRKGRFIRVGDILHWLLGGDEHTGIFTGIEEGKLAVDDREGNHHLIDARDVLSSERPKATLRALPPAERPDPDEVYRESLDLREAGKVEEADAISSEARAASNKWKRDIKLAIAYGDISPEDAFERWQWASKADNGEWAPLPDTLYHVTTAKDAVLADRLRSRDELEMMSGHGLGGGASDTISLTDDPEIAAAIADAMVEAHHVANGDISVENLLELAERGEGTKRPFLRDIVHYYGQYETYAWREKYQSENGIWEPGDPYPRALIAELEQQHTGHFYDGKQTDTPEASRLDFYKVFSFLRQGAGGPMDPLFFTSDAQAIADMDPDQVAMLKVHPVPGAVGERVQGLAEYRVPTGDVLEIDPGEGAPVGLAVPGPKSSNLIELKMGSVDEIKKQAAEWSAAHPGEYAIVVNDFGPFLVHRKSLGVYGPSDSALDVYWFNGKEKKFTEAQRIADQNATPMLSVPGPGGGELSPLTAREIGRVPVPLDYRPKFSLEGNPRDFYPGEDRPYRVRNQRGERIGIVELAGIFEDGEKNWEFYPDAQGKPLGSGPTRKAAVNDSLNKREDLTIENIFPDMVKASDLGTDYFIKRDLSSEMTWDELRQQTVDDAKRTGLYDKIAKNGILLPIQIFVPKTNSFTKGTPEISTGHHRLAIAQDLGIDVPVRWYGPGYYEMTGQRSNIEGKEYRTLEKSLQEPIDPERFGPPPAEIDLSLVEPRTILPPPHDRVSSVVYDGESEMNVREAQEALVEILPGLNRIRHQRIAYTDGRTGETTERDEIRHEAAIYGLDYLQPRQRAAYVQAAQHMVERYDGALNDVIELDIENQELRSRDPITGLVHTALGTTSLGERPSDNQDIAGAVITFSASMIRDGTVMGEMIYMNEATTTAKGMMDPADVVASSMTHEFAHAVHMHQVMQGYADKEGIPLQRAYSWFNRSDSKFGDLLRGNYEVRDEHGQLHSWDPFPVRPIYDQVQRDNTLYRDPETSLPTEYSTKSPAEFYAEMVTADVQHMPIPEEEAFHALDALAQQMPGQEALNFGAPAAVAASGAPTDPAIFWSDEQGWVIVDPLGFVDGGETEASPIPMMAYAMVPIHSAADLEQAIAAAEADDTMRWYVERRARAFGVEVQWSVDA